MTGAGKIALGVVLGAILGVAAGFTLATGSVDGAWNRVRGEAVRTVCVFDNDHSNTALQRNGRLLEVPGFNCRESYETWQVI